MATMTGVTVAELDPLTMLRIQTKSTFCEVTVPRPPLARVLVRGGRFFTELAAARFGGSCVKLTWSGVWPHLELHALDEWIVTSRVQSISILNITAAYGHV